MPGVYFFPHNPTDYLNLNDWHYAFNVEADNAYIREEQLAYFWQPLASSLLSPCICMFVYLVAPEGLSERVVMKPGNYKQWRKFEGKKDEQEATNNKKPEKDYNVDIHGYCNSSHTK